MRSILSALPHLDLSLQWGDLPAIQAQVHRRALSRTWATRTLRTSLLCDAQLTVRVVDEDEGRMLNRSYRGKDYATNVLTFDYAQTPLVTADLVLCAAVVEREALVQGKTLRQHYAHLLVHGVLHAQGYDHETSASEADEMESLEVLLVRALGWPNPY